jgi:YesN/AraC family two-component response regulator
VNKYRIDYAQQLMRQQPGIKITEVYIKSGFANETSFFRTFKMIVGMTPKEWMAQND